MRDWKTIAGAAEPGFTPEELERIAPALESLEAAFRPLTLVLPSGAEPAVVFRAAEGGE
jgi:hypothetical protein